MPELLRDMGEILQGALGQKVVHPSAVGIVHIGLGAFHRAHQAFYTDQIIRQGHKAWGIVAVNLRSREIVDALNAQGFLFCRWEKEEARETINVVSSLVGALHLPSQRDQIMAHFIDPGVSVITVTVSEKGYYFDPKNNSLDSKHSNIVSDLNNPKMPGTLPGLLYAAFCARKAANTGPLTVISCDNYNKNGHVLRAVVEGYASQCDPDLLHWMSDNISFPSSMVDGIVPRITERDKLDFTAKTDLVDNAPVIAESYRRWVIEDDFAGARPSWDLAGAEFVRDVEPYEAAKLHLLNAPHSAVAYLGHSSGMEYIYDAISNSLIKNYTQRLIFNELLPTVAEKCSFDPEPYASQVIPRFSNPNIRHPIWQVVSDGSLKIPQRILPIVEKRLAKNLSIKEITLAIAAWMNFLRFLSKTDQCQSNPDPIAEELGSIVKNAGEDLPGLVDGLLALQSIFPDALAGNQTFRRFLIKHATGLREHGVLTWLSIQQNDGTTE